MLEYRVLGPVTITTDGEPVRLGGPRQRRLVAMLLVHRNAVVSSDRLAEIVFAGEPTPAAQTTLRSYVSRLRKVVDGNGDGPPSNVVTRPPGYMLAVADDVVDVGRFERLLDAGRTHLERDDPAAAAAAFRDALALWRGDPYAEFAQEDWARPEAQRLVQLRLLAHEHLIDAELACGRAADVIPTLESLIVEHPLRDGFRARLMLALYRSGRQVDALRAFQDYRSVLGEELGLEPSPELIDVERRILEHDPNLQLDVPSGRPLRGYRLMERLGTGRDGTVYAASLPGVDRELAIRVYREDVADQPDFVRSFEADAQKIAALRHEAIVPITDYWREPGAAYLVMRRMRGGTLRDRLQQGPLTMPEAAEVAARIGAALTIAAEHGIVHGRVAPESVLIDEWGTPHLSDFTLGSESTDPEEDRRRFSALIAEIVPPGATAELRALVAGPGRGIGELTADLASAVAADVEGGQARPNPYKGLRAFDESDTDDFFGRDVLIGEILARLRRDDLPGRLVLMVGGSGSGKSSVMRAGVLPRLRGGAVQGSHEWFVTTMVPGSAPFKELAESLRRISIVELADLAEELGADELGIDRVVRRLVPENGQVVLAVDQLEELFTLASERDQRLFVAAVMAALRAPDSRLRVVATLRADFYDRPLQFQGLGAVLHDVTVTVPAMSAAELEEAIVAPAQRVGMVLDRSLAAELVAAAVDQPLALPSLQFALYQLAERSPDGRLTVDNYRALGGLDGAITSRAEQLYGTLEGAERDTVRHMFERLVVVSAEAEATRRRALRPELTALGDGATIDHLVESWVQARLLAVDRDPTSREPTVEVAHEALLREWPRVRGWIEEHRETIVTIAHLRDAAAGWAELGRDRGALYRGARLEHVLDVTDAEADRLPPLEREFLDASRKERDDEHRREAERVARQARANRRLRIQLAAIAVALVIAVLGGFLALDQREEARRQGGIAVARELAAAAVANVEVDSQRSMLLALEAVARTRSDDGTGLPEASEALHRAVTASRVVLTVPDLGGALDWSPDGERFVTEGPEESGLVDIRDARTGRSVAAFPAHDPDVNDVAFSPDGSLLASTGDDGTARIWRLKTRQEMQTVDGAPGSVWAPTFSPDGERFAASWGNEGLVRVIDVTTGRTIREVGVSAPSFGSVFSPDGLRLAIASFDEGVVVVDVASGERRFAIAGGGDGAPGAIGALGGAGILSVDWSPDGRLIATAGLDGTVGIADAVTGRPLFSLFGHTSEVLAVDWSPDSSRLVSGSGDGTAKVWQIGAAAGRELLSLSADDRSGGVWAAFSPDGQKVMTGNQDISAVTIWDVSLAGDAEWTNAPADPAQFSGVAFTPDGRHVITSDGDGSMTAWDATTGSKGLSIGKADAPGDPAIHTIEPSPDGELLASAGPELSASVWDLRTGRMLFDAGPGPVDIAWSPDGAVLAVAQNFGPVGITDRAGGHVATLETRPGFNLTAVEFSPGGRLLATAQTGADRANPATDRVTLWDWKQQRVDATLDTSAQVMAFDPTGEQLAVAPLLGDPQIWDVDRREQLATLRGHKGVVHDIAYSPSGDLIATASADGTIRLWESESWTPTLVLRGHQSVVWDLDFSRDGSKLATLGGGGVARVWALDLDDLVEIAHRELTRSLSDAECRQYLHVDRCPGAR